VTLCFTPTRTSMSISSYSSSFTPIVDITAWTSRRCTMPVWSYSAGTIKCAWRRLCLIPCPWHGMQWEAFGKAAHPTQHSWNAWPLTSFVCVPGWGELGAAQR
jgi:hypothetical protein